MFWLRFSMLQDEYMNNQEAREPNKYVLSTREESWKRLTMQTEGREALIEQW
jgi:hypothetical protein